MARKLSETSLAKKRRYDIDYKRENYGTFHVALPKDELKEVKELIISNGFNFVEFFRLCIKLLKEGKIKKD
jgi:hypothetical protein